MINMFKLDIPIFNKKVKIIYNNTIEELNNYLYRTYNRHTDEEYSSGCALEIMNDSRDIIMFIPEWEDNDEMRSVIIHESLHIVNIILKYCNIPTDVKDNDYNDEIQAYLLEYIFNKVYNKLKDK